MKRISLSATDAEHVYEWLRMYWRGEDPTFGGCYECERVGRRLERLIGPAAVRRIARIVRDNSRRTRTATKRRVGGKKTHAKKATN
jgi:hypothetical protein